MTRGEKIAWIWVWCAMALVVIGSPFAVWHYWRLPLAHLEAQFCVGSNDAVAMDACERLLANEYATTESRSLALRKLADHAQHGEQREVVIERLTALIELGTATPEDWNLRGLNYYWLRNYDKAAEDFRQATRMNEAVGLYWANLGDALNEAGDHAAAIEIYTTALAKGAGEVDVLGRRGWARYKLSLFAEALADYDKALAKDPGHFNNLNDRGLVRHALKDYRPALADFDAALKLSPESATILTNRAASYSRLGEWEKAQGDLDRAIVLDAGYVPARLEKAWLFIDQKMPESALAELKALESSVSFDMEVFEIRAQAHADLGQWEAALGNADKAVELGDRAAWLFELRADVRYELGDDKGAIADATAALETNPSSTNALVKRAFALLSSGQAEAAFADVDRAVETAANSAYVFELRSYFNTSWGRIDAALADARRSVALAPDSASSSVALGRVLSERGDGAGALAECNRALSLDETDSALRCRALAYLVLQQPSAAAADIGRALAMNKRSVNNRIVSGRAELALGNARRAIELFDEAIRMSTYDKAGAFMYRGDAERALGNIEKARIDYQEAKKHDLGQYTSALAGRLSALSPP